MNLSSKTLSALLTTTLCLLPACSGGGGGGGGSSFLEEETRVNTGTAGASNAYGPELVQAGTRTYVVYVDDRNGTEELFLNWSDDGGKTWQDPDVRVPGAAIGPLGVDPEGRKLAVDGNTVVAVFEESDDMFTNVSTDGGATWLAAATRLDAGGVNAADSDDPTVVTSGGDFYAVWRDEAAGPYDVLFSSSTDGGMTWSAATQVNTSAAGSSLSDNIRMAVNAAGDLYVVFEDDRNDPGGEKDILFNRSTDGGATWLGADVQVNSVAAADAGYAKLCVDGTNLYVAFADDRTGDDAVYFQRSTDGGTTWAVNDVRLDTTAPGVDIGGPRMVADGARIAVGWQAQDPGSEDDIFLNLSDDGGMTWLPAPLRMDQDAPGAGDSDDGWIGVRGETIAVVWEDDRSGIDDIYMRYSLDWGATWSDERLVERIPPGTEDADMPRVVVSDAGILAVWQDHRNGLIDIYANGGKPKGF